VKCTAFIAIHASAKDDALSELNAAAAKDGLPSELNAYCG
jgi:hypothetical protein